MKTLMTLTAGLSLMALAACGDKAADEKKADEMPATSEAPATDSMADTMDAAKETMEQVAQALMLDTSSMAAFQSSLAEMKASLSEEDQSKLMAALGKLAGNASDDGKSGMMDAAKGMASGKSMTDVLYEKMGDELHGMSFDEILDMAK